MALQAPGFRTHKVQGFGFWTWGFRVQGFGLCKGLVFFLNFGAGRGVLWSLKMEKGIEVLELSAR